MPARRHARATGGAPPDAACPAAAGDPIRSRVGQAGTGPAMLLIGALAR